MSFWDSMFQVIFGRRGESSPPPPPPVKPPPKPPAAPPRAPAPPPAAAPPPVAPPPVAPTPAAPIPDATPPPLSPAPQPTPPPIFVETGPPPGFALETLTAATSARVTGAEIAAMASELGVEANVISAVIKVESAGPGFGADGRPLILFEPFWFSQATGGRFDASNPNVSQPTIRRADLGGNQAARWSKLAEAYGLDAAAALGATSWGAFQIPGRYFQACGHPTVFAFVQDVSTSETRQLAAFKNYIVSQGLVDELQRRDWDAFARAYEGEAGAGQYSSALAAAYATLTPTNAGGDGFLDSLVAQNPAPLTRDDYAAVAQMLGCEVEAVQAVVQVESGRLGAFAADGKPVILYEPHIFSRRTNRRFDVSHPSISYRSWDATKYPRTQEGRWDQLRDAYALAPEDAVASASYGLFQIMGFNHQACGFNTAKEFVADMSKSQARQLAAFAAFVRSNNLDDELVRKDWEGFARGYNGSGQVERYGRLMREAYEAIKASA